MPSNSTIMVLPNLFSPTCQGRELELPQYVFKEGSKVVAQNATHVLNHDRHWLNATYGTQHLREKIAFIPLCSMFTAKAEWLAWRSRCNQAHPPPKVVPANVPNISLKHRYGQRASGA
ncbi:MAG: hypothetical protein WAL89_00530 [Candidatus Sulfotelmatobacter sp.]|jgi:peroxiredoxin